MDKKHGFMNKNIAKKMFDPDDGVVMITKSNINGEFSRYMTSGEYLCSKKLIKGQRHFVADSTIVSNEEAIFPTDKVFAKKFISYKIKITGDPDWARMKDRDINNMLKYLSNCVTSRIKKRYDIEPLCIIAESGFLYPIFSFNKYIILNSKNNKKDFLLMDKLIYGMLKDAIEGVNYSSKKTKHEAYLSVEKRVQFTELVPMEGSFDDYNRRIRAYNRKFNKKNSGLDFKVFLHELKKVNKFKFKAFGPNDVKNQDLDTSKFIAKMSNNRIRGIISYIYYCKYNLTLTETRHLIYKVSSWLCQNIGLDRDETFVYIKNNIEPHMGGYALDAKNAIRYIDKGIEMFNDTDISKLTNESVCLYLGMSEDAIKRNVYFRTNEDCKKDEAKRKLLKDMADDNIAPRIIRTSPEEKAVLIVACECSTLSVEDTMKKICGKDRQAYYRAKHAYENEDAMYHDEIVHFTDALFCILGRKIKEINAVNFFGHVNKVAKIEIMIKTNNLKSFNLTTDNIFGIITVADANLEEKIRKEKRERLELKETTKEPEYCKNIQSGMTSYDQMIYWKEKIKASAHNMLSVVRIKKTEINELLKAIKEYYTEDGYLSARNTSYKRLALEKMSEEEKYILANGHYHDIIAVDFSGHLRDYGIPILQNVNNFRKKIGFFEKLDSYIIEPAINYKAYTIPIAC